MGPTKGYLLFERRVTPPLAYSQKSRSRNSKKMSLRTNRVYVSQIDPRKRYHSMFLSLRAYSDRSRVACGGGVRRRTRERNSISKAAGRALFARPDELRWAASKEAIQRKKVHSQISLTLNNGHTIDQWSKNINYLCQPILRSRQTSY